MTWWIAQHLAVASLLVAVVHVLTRVARIRPAGRHALWVIVLIKLVTPPIGVFAWPWTSALPVALRGQFLRAPSRDLVTASELVHGVQPSTESELAVGFSSAGPRTAATPPRIADQQAVSGLPQTGRYSVVEYL